MYEKGKSNQQYFLFWGDCEPELILPSKTTDANKLDLPDEDTISACEEAEQILDRYRQLLAQYQRNILDNNQKVE